MLGSNCECMYAVFSPVYFKRLNLRAFSEQFPLIFEWVELLGFDVVVNSAQDTPSHYALRKFWGEHWYAWLL